MSTAPNRTQAKKAVVTRDQADPELSEAISEGKSLQIALKREENSHAVKMRDRDLGQLGKYIGDGTHLPTFVAAGVVVIAFLLGFLCLLIAWQAPTSAAFWGARFDQLVGLAGAAMAYIFGAASKK